MAPLSFSPIVPEAIYRFRNADRELYLEWQSDGIKAAPLKADNYAQQWKVTNGPDDTYLITNVGSNAGLSTVSYDDNGTQKFKISSGGSQLWSLEPRGAGKAFILGVAQNGLVCDLASNDVVILWERNHYPNQRWILDSVGPLSGQGGAQTGPGSGTGTEGGGGILSTPGAPSREGVYFIRNRATMSHLLIFAQYSPPSPVHVIRGAKLGDYVKERSWTVKPVKLAAGSGGVTLVNSYAQREGQYLKETIETKPKANMDPQILRLIPVAGTRFFHIAMTMAANSRVLADPKDTNTPGDTALVGFDKDDETQHWEFRLLED